MGNTNSINNTKERKDRLSKTIRNKISIELTINPKKRHLDIAEFYGISRQLVTKIAKENNLQRCKPRGLDGSHTYPERPKANIELINLKFSNIDSRFGNVIGNFITLYPNLKSFSKF